MTADFLAVYEDNVWSVHGYLAYRTRTREEAEDLTQLTFERALKGWTRFDPTKASARTWLLAIARNALIDEHRRQRPEALIDHAGEGLGLEQMSVPGPEQSLKGVRPELEAALSQLQPRERDVLALRYGADLKPREVGDMLGLSLANVHQISSRSLRKLRAELVAHEEKEDPSGGSGSQGTNPGEPEDADDEQEQARG